jgi:hypothetical protein
MIRLLRLLLLGLLGLITVLCFPGATLAQDPPPDDQPAPPSPAAPRVDTALGATGGLPATADFSGALQTLRAPSSSAGGPAAADRGPEIFPDASRVWMSVRDADPLPIESARRGGPWICSSGQCTAHNGDPGQSKIGDAMLRSIKLQTPMLPLPLTVWGRLDEHGKRVLDFDPVLLGRRSYTHVCAYKPIDPADPKAPPRSDKEKIPICRDGPAALPPLDAGELILGFEWPKQSELSDFRYLAIVDSCGNARVQPFQRTFTVAAFEVASGGCGQADGKVLRIFPQGGWLRVTAFSLDGPATGTIVNATYRVSVPPLENAVESNPARLLFPDPRREDLEVDCGPVIRKAPTDEKGIPPPPPGASEIPLASRPPASPKTAASSPGSARPAPRKPAAPPARAFEILPTGPGPQPLAHQAVVIAPEPLRQGNCRVRLVGQTKRRLVAPLALYVSLTRTDRTVNGAPIELITDGKWIITPNAAEFHLPPLSESFDGNSRLRLVVHSDPLSPDGKVVLLSDAGRAASARKSNDSGDAERARRPIGSLVIHSVPLCGASNFETAESVGSCIRAYVTIPALLATLQVTRAPWVERPLITRSVLSALGIALAIDSYDPLERKAFPVAAQIGGFVESLGDGRLGMLGYIGIAPTIPILGTGGNTTSFGLLGGLGVSYITNEVGPDEGLKPAAFLGLVVQVGQVSPAFSASGSARFGSSAGP